MDNSDSLKREQEVFRGSTDLVSITTTEIIEVRNLLKDEIDEGNDDGDSKGIGIDSDDSDDIGPMPMMSW